MVGQQHLVKAVQRRVDRRDLNQDVRTVSIVFYHLSDAAHLTLDPVQAVDEILILFLCPFLGSMTAFPIFFHPRIPPSLLHYIPYRGILQGKIRQILSDFFIKKNDRPFTSRFRKLSLMLL